MRSPDQFKYRRPDSISHQGALRAHSDHIALAIARENRYRRDLARDRHDLKEALSNFTGSRERGRDRGFYGGKRFTYSPNEAKPVVKPASEFDPRAGSITFQNPELPKMVVELEREIAELLRQKGSGSLTKGEANRRIKQLQIKINTIQKGDPDEKIL